MAVATITGPIYGASFTDPFLDMRLIFELSHWEQEADIGLFASGPVLVPVDPDGNFSVSLFVNGDGENVSHYKLFAEYTKPDFLRQRVYLGYFSLTDSTTKRLDQLTIITDEETRSLLDVYGLVLEMVNNTTDNSALSRAWAEGVLPPNPEDPTSKSAKSWAELAEQAVDSVAALSDRITQTFEIAFEDSGRGPYAVDYNPGLVTLIDLYVNGVMQSPIDHFQLVAMPSSPSGKGILFNDDQNEGHRVDVKFILPVGYDPVQNTGMDFTTLGAFASAVTAGLIKANGSTITAGGVHFTAKSGAAIAGLPAGWIASDQVYTRAQVEAMGDIWPGQNCILVDESGFVLPFLRDPLATDLIGTDGTSWRKAGMSVADAVAIGTSVANSAVFAVNSSDIYATYGGTANAITLTTGKPYTAIPVGAQIRFKATNYNTGPTTVSVDGLPPVAVLTVPCVANPAGIALPEYYIRNDVETVITYNGTNWIASRAIETGTDANGTYVCYENGVMEVTKLLTGLGPISSALGSLFSSSTITVGTLAADFLTGTVPTMKVFGHGNGIACWVQGIADPVAGSPSTGGSFGLLRATSSAAVTFKADCCYHGRWF